MKPMRPAVAIRLALLLAFVVSSSAIALAASTVHFTSDLPGSQPIIAATVCAKGEFPASSSLVTDHPGIHAIVKRRWNDGSPKHVVLAGRLTFPDAVTATPVSLLAGTPSSATPLTSADIVAASPQASVTLTNITNTIGAASPVALPDITASLATALVQPPIRTWLSTPDLVECHYLLKPRADLYVWFHVRLWSDGRCWVRTVVEYSKLPYTSATKLTYTPAVSLGGALAWNNASAPYTHALETRWTIDGWAAGTPVNVTVRHDPDALRHSKLVPNGLLRTPTESQLNALFTTYAPGGLAGLRPSYGDTGYHEQIGLLPGWDMFYLASGDPRAWRAVLASSTAAGTHATIWRDPNTSLAVRPSDWPTWTAAGANQGGFGLFNAASQTPGLTYSWDSAHNASSGYLAYLITGDYLHLETMHMQCSSLYLMNSSSNGSGTARITFGQTRSQGWFFRTSGQLAGIAPDGDTVAADMAERLYKNALHHKAAGPDSIHADNSLGYPMTISTYDAGAPLSVAPWMHNFWIQSMGHASDLEPLPDTQMADFNAVRDWMYKGIVNYLGDGTPGTFDYRYTGNYTLTVSDLVRPSFALTYPDQLHQNWGQVWTSTLPSMNAAADSNGYPRPGTTTTPMLYSASWSYYLNYLPALAYAVDHNAPGAAAAWNRVSAAYNWESLASTAFSQPMWAVAPRAKTPLPHLIAGMSPDSWRTLALTNINHYETAGPYGAMSILETEANYPLTNWGGKWWYDPTTGLIGGVGTAQGHSSDNNPVGKAAKYIEFDTASQTFSVRWNPTGANEGHVYDANCSLVHQGKTYRKSFNADVIKQLDVVSGVWSTSPYTTAGLSPAVVDVCALEIHPTLGAQGSLLLHSDTRLIRWDLATGQRTVHATGLTGFHGRYAVMHYVPGWNRVILGGGETITTASSIGASWYSIDATGTVAATGWTSPVRISCGSDAGVFLPDPSGRPRSWWYSSADDRIYSLDWTTLTWTPRAALPQLSAAWTGVSLRDRHALMFFEGRGRTNGFAQGRVLLYKVDDESAPPPTTFTAWQAQQSWSGADSSETADPDADGLSNLTEYALRLSPLTPDAHLQPAPVSSGGNLTLSYTTDTTRTDVTYQPQRSTDLVTWTSTAAFITTQSGTLQTWTTSIPATGPRQFLRLRVTR
jgi:hypothetical protein